MPTAGSGQLDHGANQPHRRALGQLLGHALLALFLAASIARLLLEVVALFEASFADFPIFFRAAQRVADGAALYVHADDLAAYRPSAAVYKYPPLYAALIVPFARFDRVAVERGHLVVLLAFAVATLLLLRRLQRGAGAGPKLALLACCCHFGPLYETLKGLQLELPILFLVALAAVAAAPPTRRSATWEGAALGAAVLLKLYPAPLLAPLLIGRRWRALAAAAGAIAALALLGLLVVSVADHRFYAFELLPYLLRELPSHALENVAPARALAVRCGLDDDAARRAARLLVAPLALAVLLALLRWRRRDPATRRAGVEAAVMTPLLLLALPNAWLNYQVLLLLPFAVIAAAAPRSRHRRLLLALLAAATLPLLFTGDSLFSAWLPPPAQRFWRGMIELRALAPLLTLAAALVVAAEAQPARATRE